MTRGTVKWFNNVKGYGFIIPENGGGDVFAHYSTIDMEGYKTLRAGQEVRFEAVEGPSGMQTSQVKSVEDVIDGMGNRPNYNSHQQQQQQQQQHASTNFPMK
jgi:CspA family cold shock protein